MGVWSLKAQQDHTIYRKAQSVKIKCVVYGMLFVGNNILPPIYSEADCTALYVCLEDSQTESKDTFYLEIVESELKIVSSEINDFTDV